MRKAKAKQRRYHIDRRAHLLRQNEPPRIGHNNPPSPIEPERPPPPADDDLLTTRQVSEWLVCSTQWLEIGRLRGYGPKYVKVGPKMVRYTRAAVRAYLRERERAHEAEQRRRAERAA
jgi:predicted DNA-binding transcriptional regulator AlpA